VPAAVCVAVIAVTDSDRSPVSRTITKPAGTVIGELQSPTGTETVELKPLPPVTVNWNVPVSPEPVTICLQTSTTPVTRVSL
jgi:hypothetical protein